MSPRERRRIRAANDLALYLVVGGMMLLLTFLIYLQVMR